MELLIWMMLSFIIPPVILFVIIYFIAKNFNRMADDKKALLSGTLYPDAGEVLKEMGSSSTWPEILYTFISSTRNKIKISLAPNIFVYGDIFSSSFMPVGYKHWSGVLLLKKSGRMLVGRLLDGVMALEGSSKGALSVDFVTGQIFKDGVKIGEYSFEGNIYSIGLNRSFRKHSLLPPLSGRMSFTFSFDGVKSRFDLDSDSIHDFSPLKEDYQLVIVSLYLLFAMRRRP